MSDRVRTFQELTEEQGHLAGGKGGSLARLVQAGFPVPSGFVIPPACFSEDDLTSDAWEQVEWHLARMRHEHLGTFAVRSSALSEDSLEASFAGEFETVLNVSTDDDIHKAILMVYRSRTSERVQAYSQAKGMGAAHEIAVIVQQMVPAERSGVLFTVNPVTGRRSEAIVNAAWGLGEAVVGGLVTPDTLTVEKENSRILARETADKHVMTVPQGSGTVEAPVPEARRTAPVLSDEEAAELVRIGVEIEALYDMPMDIEWALAGGEFAILQARPITALPEEEAPAPTEWKSPGIAMRNNIVELMPDPLTPLFATLGLSAVNASMHRLLESSMGMLGIMPEEIIITVNEYAYYNGNFSFMQILRILFVSPKILKLMFTGAVERWTEIGRPRYLEVVDAWKATAWREFSNREILEGVRELSEAAIDAYGAMVSGVIPAAWISEALFTMSYRLIRRRSDPTAPTFLLGYNSIPIQAEKSLFDLAVWASERPELAAFVRSTPTQELTDYILREDLPPLAPVEDWRVWQRQFQEHLARFGHMIYNLDFAVPVPVDDPAPLLETCKLMMEGQGTDPHERQRAAEARREASTQGTLNRLRGPRLKLFQKFLTPAQRYAPLREDSLADVGWSYPILRAMLHELGCRFVDAGVIVEPDDIYWLEGREAEETADRLDRGESPDPYIEKVPQRRAVWRTAMRLTPPVALPQIKIFGRDLRKRSEGKGAGTLKGVAASPGIVTAPACVVSGPQDFANMKSGDVLVAAITTPAWTPLFARAAAVVTDVGGPLSHGSIVAREYGIPAVLGTGAATRRIRSGQIVTVDGSAGTVTMMEPEPVERGP
jgi:phosphohistidine swiveling domain-containing protein